MGAFDKDMAKEANEIMRQLGPLLQKRDNMAATIALLNLAAHHAFHDGVTNAEFQQVAEHAWERTLRAHPTPPT